MAALVVLATTLLGFGQQALWRPAVHAASRVSKITAMPSATPKVPYKYPGMESPTWIDVYNRMYRERIMFLGKGIEDSYANTIISVLLYLESEDANSPVAMYYNVPGGITKSGLAIYDTMRVMPYEIQTVNMGMCAQIAAFLVAGGTPGKRYALPNARFALMNPSIEPPVDNEGNPRQRIMQATEMQLEVEEVLRDKKRMLEGYSKFTGRSVDVLRKDFMRDFYLTAPEAATYGLIDKILPPKRPSKLGSKSDIKFGAFEGVEQRYGDQDFAASPAATESEQPPAESA